MSQMLDLEAGTQNGGIYANKPGYHNTRDANLPTNYSVILAPDKLGPGDKAAAYDWTFPEAQSNDFRRIAKYSGRLYVAGRDHDPRIATWREFFGQLDADFDVEGWDFYRGRPSTSDSSHLWHIHLSELRAYVEDMDSKRALLSVLRGQSLDDWLGEDDVELTDVVPSAITPDNTTRNVDQVYGDLWHGVHGRIQRIEANVNKILALLQAGVPVEAGPSVNLSDEALDKIEARVDKQLDELAD
jgi:hypothetical protein